MAYYTCHRCMKHYKHESDERDDRLACPVCHAQVSPREGKPPLTVSNRALLFIHQHKLYTKKPTPDRTLARRNSLSKTLDAYTKKNTQWTASQGTIAAKLTRLRNEYPARGQEHLDDVSSMDVYPLILAELSRVLKKADIEFVLYGSAALWLEGNPRPQERVHIKDMDMCLSSEPSERAGVVELLKTIIQKTLAMTAIDFASVFTTKGNTTEFISGNENVQFSFNLQEPAEFVQTKGMSVEVDLFGDPSSTVRVAGMSFIAKRLLAPGGLLETRLFRPDKTEQTLMYSAMALGFSECNTLNTLTKLKSHTKLTVDEVADAICLHSIQRSSKDLVNKLKETGTASFDKQRTKFYDATQLIVDTYEQAMSNSGNELSAINSRIRSTIESRIQELSQPTSETKRKIAQEERNNQSKNLELVNTRKSQLEADAEKALRTRTLEFIIHCLNDVDKKLLKAEWLEFNRLITIKKGKQLLIKALEARKERL